MMDNAKATVTMTDINAQRAKGWPDFDPEDYCHRCGRPNVRSWFVSSPLWNAAEIENDTPSGIICPSCFVAAFETTENGHVSWELRPDPLTMHNMNPALREANDEWLASYQSSRGVAPLPSPPDALTDEQLDWMDDRYGDDISTNGKAFRSLVAEVRRLRAAVPSPEPSAEESAPEET